MRRTPFFAFLLMSGVLLAACDDSMIPLSAYWLEWPVVAAPGRPFEVRLFGYTDAGIDNLRVKVRIDGDTVTLEPYGLSRKCEDLCRSVYNPVVQVPGIATPTARTMWIRASIGGPLQEPMHLRIFGPVVVTEAVPMDFDRRGAGIASGRQNSSGCYEISPWLDGSVSGVVRFVSFDQTPDWAPGFTGFVYGRIQSTLQSCGAFDARVMVLDSIK